MVCQYFSKFRGYAKKQVQQSRPMLLIYITLVLKLCHILQIMQIFLIISNQINIKNSLELQRLQHNLYYVVGSFFYTVCNDCYTPKCFMKGLNKMDGYEISDKKSEIIRATWSYLLRTGLTHASVGDLCREEKLAQSSLYYWFENKDDIWISAGKYGLSRVVDELFAYTLTHTNDIRKYFDTLLDEVEKYKCELRIALQVTTSPVFGERMRNKSKDFRQLYKKYANELILIFGCSYLQAETFIYSIIAYVIDYVIWDDKDKTQMLLENLYNRTKNVLDKT